MAPKANLTKVANISATTRQIDFVSRFASNVEALMQIMGISRLIEETPGADLRVLTGGVTLQSGNVGEGEEIPYSLATVSESTIAKATLNKYCKAVSIEAIDKYGYDIAVEMTDSAFINKLQNIITSQFYTFLATGTLTSTETTFQMALAMARGKVIEKFQSLDLDVSEVVGFVNTTDFYKYLGGANITTQTAFGMQYISNFMGYRTIFLADDDRVSSGKIYATPVENIVCYYINPAHSDYARAGLEFSIDGDTPLLGCHIEGNYKTLVSENTAIMGIYLFAEHLDGISAITINSGN